MSPSSAGVAGRPVASCTAPFGLRRRTTSCPAGRARGSTATSGSERETPPGTHPRHHDDHREAGGRRSAPSGRVERLAPRMQPRRPGVARRRRTAPEAGGRSARRLSPQRRATRAVVTGIPMQHGDNLNYFLVLACCKGPRRPSARGGKRSLEYLRLRHGVGAPLGDFLSTYNVLCRGRPIAPEPVSDCPQFLWTVD